MRLLISSNIAGFSGYSKSLRELGVALRHTGIETLSVQPSLQDQYLPEKALCLRSEQAQAQSGDAILFRPYFETFPAHIEAEKHGINLIAFVALESTKYPERLVKECNLNEVKQVWVPSEHCKESAINSGIIEDKIRVVPHGYDPTIFKVKKREPSSPFTLLYVGGYTGRGDRKGADILAEAFKDEFKPEEKVELLMKINTSYGPLPIHDLTIDPRIKISTDNLLDKEMPNVYKLGDCFVCPSYGEAFNMTTLEAMACGLPIITNTWSGELTYLSKIFDKRILPVFGRKSVPRYNPWELGYWIKPDKGHLKVQLRKAFEEKHKVKRYKNIEKFTWHKASLIAKKYLEEL